MRMKMHETALSSTSKFLDVDRLAAILSTRYPALPIPKNIRMYRLLDHYLSQINKYISISGWRATPLWLGRVKT